MKFYEKQLSTKYILLGSLLHTGELPQLPWEMPTILHVLVVISVQSKGFCLFQNVGYHFTEIGGRKEQIKEWVMFRLR